ncbi:MAG TPA: winged helix-turn-helix domain-containing protein, partial [Microthrixaceae bacterium]|nr:winged helix-turn-helix domain-containing protein [Microthrixaceae bacterium]
MNIDDLRPGRQKVLRLFNALRDDIVAGRFSETQTLPGSRALAEMLQISRGTVNMAYAMLAAEGLITIRSKASPQILYRAP